MNILKMMPISNKYFKDHYTNELTEFLDAHMEFESNRHLNYCMRYDDRYIAIRYPAATRGHIEIDENNVVVDIKLYNMTGGNSFGGKIYEDGTDLEILKFVGYKIEWGD